MNINEDDALTVLFEDGNPLLDQALDPISTMTQEISISCKFVERNENSRIQHVYASGGLSYSPYWTFTLAEIMGVDVEVWNQQKVRLEKGVQTLEGWSGSRHEWADILQYVVDQTPESLETIQFTRVHFDEQMRRLRNQNPGDKPVNFHPVSREVTLSLRGVIRSDRPERYLGQYQRNLLTGNMEKSSVSFSELNKEQKQLLILAVGGTFTLLMVLSNLLIAPAKAAAEAGRKNVAEFELKVSRGERMLRRHVLIQKETEKLSSTVMRIYREHLPPEVSRYIWALEQISQLGEDLGLQLTVQEHPGARYIPIRDKGKLDVNSIPMWIPYSVDVNLNTSFENLKKFLTLLHECYPYCSVGKLEIPAAPMNPENHNIALLLEWPILRLEEDLAWVRSHVEEEMGL